MVQAAVSSSLQYVFVHNKESLVFLLIFSKFKGASYCFWKQPAKFSILLFFLVQQELSFYRSPLGSYLIFLRSFFISVPWNSFLVGSFIRFTRDSETSKIACVIIIAAKTAIRIFYIDKFFKVLFRGLLYDDYR